jgi:fructosamine-3-kinase
MNQVYTIIKPISGGRVNKCHCIELNDEIVFMKTNDYDSWIFGLGKESLGLLSRLCNTPDLIFNTNTTIDDKILCCLLHGDLNSENWNVTVDNKLYLFDLTPFYGAREYNIASLMCFNRPIELS